uniref:Uncharacterized protein n=1 Tax=Oryza brachyantha TaxID=4533 RepID=J3M953_ORYBR
PRPQRRRRARHRRRRLLLLLLPPQAEQQQQVRRHDRHLPDVAAVVVVGLLLSTAVFPAGVQERGLEGDVHRPRARRAPLLLGPRHGRLLRWRRRGYRRRWRVVGVGVGVRPEHLELVEFLLHLHRHDKAATRPRELAAHLGPGARAAVAIYRGETGGRPPFLAGLHRGRIASEILATATARWVSSTRGRESEAAGGGCGDAPAAIAPRASDAAT